jgi:lambda repressor-like predicted transcriptional regulator
MLHAFVPHPWFKFGHWHATRALNLYRDNGFPNMAQAQRRAGFSLNTLKDLFRMK